MKANGWTLAELVIALGFIFVLACGVGCAWVVIHFIVKWW